MYVYMCIYVCIYIYVSVTFRNPFNIRSWCFSIFRPYFIGIYSHLLASSVQIDE